MIFLELLKKTRTGIATAGVTLVRGCRRPKIRSRPLDTALVLAASLFPSSGQSQSITPNTQTLDVPDFVAQSASAGGVLPKIEMPRQQDLEGLVGGIRVHVRDYRLIGNSILDAKTIRRITAPYRDRAVSFAELQALREDLTLAYVERGYITSGVLLPEQTVRDATVQFQAIEGRLTEYRIQTDGRFRPDYFANRLRLSAEPVVKLDRIEERLQLLQQDPRIDSLRAALRPTRTLGEASLDVEVSERSPYRGSIGLDNYSTPSLGSTGLRVDFDHLNVSGNGDQLLTDLRLTEGLKEFGTDYQFPLNVHDTNLRFHARLNRGDVVDSGFADLDIESDILTYGAMLTHPLYQRLNQRLVPYAGLELRRSESSLLGEPFSFSEGPVDGVAELTVLRLGAEWSLRSQRQVTAARAQFSLGLDAFGATIHDDGRPDGQFTSLLGQLQHVRRFDWRNTRLILRGEFQWAGDRLLTMEQFAIGGHASVRGYRENQLVRDHGTFASAEARISAWNSPSDPGFADLALFADAGRGRNNSSSPEPGPANLASIGVGLLGRLYNNWHYRLYWAHRLQQVDNDLDDDLQDRGLQFSLAYRWPE